MRRFAFITTLALVFASTSLLAAPKATHYVRMETSQGNITLALYGDSAPASVQNFLKYVQNGFYTDTIFHRVIGGFMIQGGGYTQDYQRKKTRAPIINEADNRLANKRGSLAMARTNDPHSGTAQFFINLVDNDYLNYRASTPTGWGYAVFGQVVEGMDIVDQIGRLPTGPGGNFQKDVPLTPVVILNIATTQAPGTTATQAQ